MTHLLLVAPAFNEAAVLPEFIDAVLRCPEMHSEEYLKAQRRLSPDDFVRWNLRCREPRSPEYIETLRARRCGRPCELDTVVVLDVTSDHVRRWLPGGFDRDDDRLFAQRARGAHLIHGVLPRELSCLAWRIGPDTGHSRRVRGLNGGPPHQRGLARARPGLASWQDAVRVLRTSPS